MKKLIVLLTIVLIASTLISCKSSDNSEETTGHSGEITITVSVTDDKGQKQTYTIKTAENNLRKALEQENLVEGEESQYGLYVKSVAGIVADYDVNGAYWAFYKDGEYLSASIDDTPVAEGDSFEIVYTK